VYLHNTDLGAKRVQAGFKYIGVRAVSELHMLRRMLHKYHNMMEGSWIQASYDPGEGECH